MNNRLAYLKVLAAIFKVSRNPEKTEAIFDLGEALHAMGATGSILKRFHDDDDGRRVIESRKWMAPIHLAELQRFPAGTLGRVYSSHLLKNKLDPNFFRQLKVEDATVFVLMRMRQCHDLWHVMTGFDTSNLGEIGLQAFMMAQIASPLSMVILSGGLFRLGTQKQEFLDAFMEAFLGGWQMGKRARRIFSVDWEANWATPVIELRNRYQVEAVNQIAIA